MLMMYGKSTYCFSGLRELGKNWTEIAGRFGSGKTATQCKIFYQTQRQELDLDDLIADYQASKVADVYHV